MMYEYIVHKTMIMTIYPIVLYSIMELSHDVSKNVCYFDLFAVTIQGLLLAKNCNKRNSKMKCCMLTILG